MSEQGHDEEGEEHGRGAKVEKEVVGHALQQHVGQHGERDGE